VDRGQGGWSQRRFFTNPLVFSDRAFPSDRERRRFFQKPAEEFSGT
jgi:hypothetical protein